MKIPCETEVFYNARRTLRDPTASLAAKDDAAKALEESKDYFDLRAVRDHKQHRLMVGFDIPKPAPWRYRFADWISGGALTRARDAEKFWNAESNEGWMFAISRASALQQIAAEAKPTSNATVKRMARMAREALK